MSMGGMVWVGRGTTGKVSHFSTHFIMPSILIGQTSETSHFYEAIMHLWWNGGGGKVVSIRRQILFQFTNTTQQNTRTHQNPKLQKSHTDLHHISQGNKKKIKKKKWKWLVKGYLKSVNFLSIAICCSKYEGSLLCGQLLQKET